MDKFKPQKSKLFIDVSVMRKKAIKRRNQAPSLAVKQGRQIGKSDRNYASKFQLVRSLRASN